MVSASTNTQLATVSKFVSTKPRVAMRSLLAVANAQLRWAAMEETSKALSIGDDAWTEPERNLAVAKRILESIPATLSEMSDAIATLHEIRRTPCDERALDILLAIMVDGYPNARPANLTAYVNALFLSIAEENAVRTHRGDGPAVSAETLAVAIRQLWAEQKFVPSAAELMAACKAAQHRWAWGIRTLIAITGKRYGAEEVLITAGELTDFTDGEGNGPKIFEEFRQLKAAEAGQ